jgi:CRP/FNR family cyclic AMP-dependent transcriptional regulator
MKSYSPANDPLHEALEFLNGLPLFEGLDQTALGDIASRMQCRTFGMGMTLFHQDMPGMMLYMLAEGHVRLYSIGHTEQEFTYHIYGPMEVFGELSLLDDGYHSETCITMAPIKTWLLSRDQLMDILQKYPTVNFRLLRILASRIRSTTRKAEAMAFQDVQGRLAYEILNLARKYGKQTCEGIVVTIHLNQNDLASMVGATRESVNKALSLLRAQNMIRFSGSSIVMTDQAGLERMLQERGR